MGVFNGIFPIIAGKEADGRAFAAEVMGPRLTEFESLQARSSVTRETWALQETPMGSFMVVWFEGNVEAAFGDLATATDDFSVWFRGRVLDICGVDMSQPPDGPLPDVLVDWSA